MGMLQADTVSLSAIVHNMGYVVDHPTILSLPQLALYREYIHGLAGSDNYSDVKLPVVNKIFQLGTAATAAVISLHYKADGSGKEMCQMFALFWRRELLTFIPITVSGWDKYMQAFPHALTLWRMCSADQVGAVCDAISAWAK